ncbi:hypothetical protein L5T15_000958 [Pseudomonas aeruginosa]|uniref:hypothetical protein n=1 Tax=Pseudomonas aeruginosa TaxID=287 RepID=UPI001CF014FC|nr:hypothetical protein [Pseudomonas aeruginosa]EIU1420726.1 hypothetical protein [Pseudomonas aeruginosa]EKU3791507.1 hypothetical protein [Pseudomonas aeruginosa]EKV3157773.1 hypothetical protein [Pseudomonas aeruginosa]EKX0258285.1 hypothetical protein [Pseudomonas aeruginosa]MDQ4185311.1 hypothetical protein [Pseudomonas aeruginosa]
MPAEPITINVRQTTGTYVAKAPGLKPTASCTTGPRQAAESLAKKLGLVPGLLQEQLNAGLGYGCSRFAHPGELATNTSDRAHCPNCGICHTREETCNEAKARVGGAA